jgi:hypothetical protein
MGEGCKEFRFRLKLLDDGRISLQQLLDGNFSVAQALVKGKVNGTKAAEAENLKDCVAVVEDSVFGKERDGRQRGAAVDATAGSQGVVLTAFRAHLHRSGSTSLHHAPSPTPKSCFTKF